MNRTGQPRIDFPNFPEEKWKGNSPTVIKPSKDSKVRMAAEAQRIGYPNIKLVECSDGLWHVYENGVIGESADEYKKIMDNLYEKDAYVRGQN